MIKVFGEQDRRFIAKTCWMILPGLSGVSMVRLERTPMFGVLRRLSMVLKTSSHSQRPGWRLRRPCWARISSDEGQAEPVALLLLLAVSCFTSGSRNCDCECVAGAADAAVVPETSLPSWALFFFVRAPAASVEH